MCTITPVWVPKFTGRDWISTLQYVISRYHDNLYKYNVDVCFHGISASHEREFGCNFSLYFVPLYQYSITGGY